MLLEYENFAFNAFCLMATIGLSACGNQQGAPQVRNQSLIMSHDQQTGPVGKILRKIQEDKHAEACDAQLHQIKMELALYLDSKQSELDVAAATTISDKDQKYIIDFEGGKIVNRPKQDSKNPSWQSATYSWQEIYDNYKKYKDIPEKKLLGYINYYVRSLLLNDNNRVRAGVNMGINKDNVEVVNQLHSILLTCKKDPTCVNPLLSNEIGKMAISVPMYNFFIEKISAAQTQ